MSSMFQRSTKPLYVALVATFGLSACSSSKPAGDLESSMPTEDSALADIGDDTDMSTGQVTLSHSAGKRVSAYRKSQKPVVHSMPVKEGEHWLNAYYFVTGDESWGTLSQKFYGREDRAELLAQWNRGASVAVGTVIYYNSPFRPQDREKMLSFGEDFGQPFERRTIASGDSLSKIAGQMWGNVHAWPAIAAVNPQLAHPDVIEVGETLFLPPTFNSQKVLTNLVKAMKSVPDPSEQLDEPSNTEDSLPHLSEAKTEVTPAIAETHSAQAPPAPSRMRSSTMIIIAGLILVLAAAVYILWSRARKAEEFGGEEGDPSKVSNLFKTKSGT